MLLICSVPGGGTLAISGAQHSQLPEPTLLLREPFNTGPPKDALRLTQTWVTGYPHFTVTARWFTLGQQQGVPMHAF